MNVDVSELCIGLVAAMLFCGGLASILRPNRVQQWLLRRLERLRPHVFQEFMESPDYPRYVRVWGIAATVVGSALLYSVARRIG